MSAYFATSRQITPFGKTQALWLEDMLGPHPKQLGGIVYVDQCHHAFWNDDYRPQQGLVRAPAVPRSFSLLSMAATT
jgi:hypothetical protein